MHFKLATEFHMFLAAFLFCSHSIFNATVQVNLYRNLTCFSQTYDGSACVDDGLNPRNTYDGAWLGESAPVWVYYYQATSITRARLEPQNTVIQTLHP